MDRMDDVIEAAGHLLLHRAVLRIRRLVLA
jgi:hypothetical protein